MAASAAICWVLALALATTEGLYIGFPALFGTDPGSVFCRGVGPSGPSAAVLIFFADTTYVIPLLN
jgi:hypothetical protein